MPNIFDDSLEENVLYTSDLRDQGVTIIPITGANYYPNSGGYAFQQRPQARRQPQGSQVRGMAFAPPKDPIEEALGMAKGLAQKAASASGKEVAPSASTNPVNTLPIGKQGDTYILPEMTVEGEGGLTKMPPLGSSPMSMIPPNMEEKGAALAATGQKLTEEQQRDVQAAEKGGFLSDIGKALSSVGKALTTPGVSKFLASAGMALAPENTAMGELGMELAEGKARDIYERRVTAASIQGKDPSSVKAPAGLSVEGRRQVISDVQGRREAEQKAALDAYKAETGRMNVDSLMRDRDRKYELDLKKATSAIELAENRDAREEGYQSLRLAATSALVAQREASARYWDWRRTNPQGLAAGTSGFKFLEQGTSLGSRIVESLNTSIKQMQEELKAMNEEYEKQTSEASRELLESQGIPPYTEQQLADLNTRRTDLQSSLNDMLRQRQEALSLTTDLYRDAFTALKGGNTGEEEAGPTEEGGEDETVAPPDSTQQEPTTAMPRGVLIWDDLSPEEQEAVPSGAIVLLPNGELIQKN